MNFLLDRKLLNHLQELSDERLWRVIGVLTSRITVEDKKINAKKLNGIRALLESLTDSDLNRINELLALIQSKS